MSYYRAGPNTGLPSQARQSVKRWFVNNDDLLHLEAAEQDRRNRGLPSAVLIPGTMRDSRVVKDLVSLRTSPSIDVDASRRVPASRRHLFLR